MTVESGTTAPRWRLSTKPAFVGVALCFWVIMLGNTLPTPLFGLYQQRLGFSSLVLTALFAVYAVGVFAALLFWGPVSDQIGRRLALLPGIGASALSAAVFLFSDGLAPLFIARVLSGLSAGIFTGAATAALLDLAGDKARGRATLVATIANVSGLGAGPLLAGFLAQFTSSPLRMPYLVQLVLLLPGAVAVAFMPETVHQRSRLRMRLQALQVPPEARAVFVRASLAGFAGFAVFGLFTAVAPSFLAQTMHLANHAVAGAVVCATFAASALGQLALGTVAEHRALWIGCLALAVGMLVVGVSLLTASLAMLVGGAIVAGLGQGLSFRAGLHAVNAAVGADRRGELVSSYFVVLYIAISLPIVGVGLITDVAGVRTASVIFSVLTAIIALVALALLARNKDGNGAGGR